MFTVKYEIKGKECYKKFTTKIASYEFAQSLILEKNVGVKNAMIYNRKGKCKISYWLWAGEEKNIQWIEYY